MPRTQRVAFCWLIVSACLTAGVTEDFDAAWQLGLAKMEAAQWVAAREAFAQALESTKNSGKKADAELQLGRCWQAEAIDGEAMKAFVNSMRWRYYAASRMRGTAWPGARDEFLRILDVPITRETAETVIFKALAEIGIAGAWQKRRAPARAETHYLKALEWLRAPQCTNRTIQRRDLRLAYIGLAEVRADQQHFAAAQKALRQLLQVPGDLRARRGVQHRLWTLCRLTNDFDAARARTLESIASADTSDTDRADLQFQIAYSYIYERRYEEARREFTKLLTMQGITPPQLSEAQLYIAHTFFVARQYAQARPLYERIVQMDAAEPACAAIAQARVNAIDALAQPSQ